MKTRLGLRIHLSIHQFQKPCDPESNRHGFMLVSHTFSHNERPQTLWKLQQSTFLNDFLSSNMWHILLNLSSRRKKALSTLPLSSLHDKSNFSWKESDSGKSCCSGLKFSSERVSCSHLRSRIIILSLMCTHTASLLRNKLNPQLVFLIYVWNVTNYLILTPCHGTKSWLKNLHFEFNAAN